ncbi:twin transmembrane helix small protein [Pararhodobacter zhoushanensis]|uniref:Twin transmembrane helix small protein n=1 Tax=Pararhodobacter zhoushanensis TaxID=2479545 RepID=A0ABT3H4G5_9RHOB|nr:twin transmembrane helix small protein [Pararhodobacter zhoushanensis]MCW1934703.1 twin transmembrane helix small protein [Pararhodobacter zhoushanensis]
MLNDPLFIIAAIASLIVLGILMFGIGSFAKGGAFNLRNANKIMRWRLGAQFVAVILIVGFAWIRSRH